MPRFGISKPINAKQPWSGISVNQVRTSMPQTKQGAVTQHTSLLGGTVIGGCTGCEPNVPYVTTLMEFLSILESLKSSIDKFYPIATVTSPFESTIISRGTVDIRVFARLEWIRQYKTVYGRFDKENPLHILLLRNEFIRFGYNPDIDKFLREWTPTPPPAAGGSTTTGDAGSATRSAP